MFRNETVATFSNVERGNLLYLRKLYFVVSVTWDEVVLQKQYLDDYITLDSTEFDSYGFQFVEDVFPETKLDKRNLEATIELEEGGIL